MKTRLLSAGMAVFLSLALTACASDDPDATPLPPLTPLALDADGATVYQARCASCHGVDLKGTDKGPSQLSIVYEPNHHGDDSYRSAIRTGAVQHHWNFGDMAPVEDITDAQIERVVVYIRSRQQDLGFGQ